MTATPTDQAGTVHCHECGEIDDGRTTFRPIRIGTRPRWVCEWCVRQAAVDAAGEPE